MNNTILIILTITLLITICFGLFKANEKFYEGMVVGAVTPSNTISNMTPTITTNPGIIYNKGTTASSIKKLTLVYSDYLSSIIGVIDQNNKPVDYNNNIIGIIYNNVYVIDGNGNTVGFLIDSSSINMIRVIDEKKNIIGFFLDNQIVSDGIVIGVFDENGALHDPKNNSSIIGFSVKNSTNYVTTSNKTPVFVDKTNNIITDNQTYQNGLNLDITQSNLIKQVDTTNIASFNYDSLYNTDNMTPKYSFMNSSFLYKSSLLDENDYLNEIYFNKNPLEMETICKKLDNETCGLTSSCVYLGNNKCVPGNKRGPYTTYSDVNLDYYYYRGKCYGNCPVQFGTTTEKNKVVETITTPTTLSSTPPTPTTLANTPTPTTLANTPTPTTLANTPTPTNLVNTPTPTTLVNTPTPTTLVNTPTPTTLASTPPTPTTLASTPPTPTTLASTLSNNTPKPF